jgi:hypothetical protein
MNCYTLTNEILYIERSWTHVKWVTCHRGMAYPQFVNRGDGLQIWRVAVNILNKQPQIADRRWSSSLGVGRGGKNPHRKNQVMLRNITHILGPGRILWHDLSNGK